MNKVTLIDSLQRCFLGGLLSLTANAAFANNVTLVREGVLAKVIGDNSANTISISQNSAGDLVVTGENGTLVNGRPSIRIRNFPINAMEVRMNGGNDRVTFSNVTIANDLFVDLGAGTDRLLTGGLPSYVGKNMTIEGGTGTDYVRLTGWTIGDDLNVLGGTGVLDAVLSGLNVGFGLTVIGDDLNDIVNVSGCQIGDTTSIETKKGGDRVAITDFIGYDLYVSTDMGSDQVSLTNVLTLEDIEVNTGTEADSVTMTTVSSGKNIKVSLDAGADSFIGTSVSAAYDAVFEGGSGTDTFGNFGVMGGTKTEIKEFEIFL